MHAVDIRRFTASQIRIAAVAIGVLLAGIIGIGVVSDITSDGGTIAVSPNVQRVPQADTIRFLELNTQLPAVVAAPARSSGEILFLEQNTLLPVPPRAVTRSFEEILFLEMNTILPAEVAPKVLSAAEILFLELNTQLPGSDTLIPPSPNESQPAGGDTRY